MLDIKATKAWKQTHPGAIIGLLEVSGIDNAIPAPNLEAEKRRVEAALRKRYEGFQRQDFLEIPAMAVYREYYKRFKKTYHVLQQVESIALKGRDLPSVSPLVDANFTAEVETLVLTAGHDVDKLQGSVSMDAATDGDEIIQMNGKAKSLYPTDMIMKDDHGICCSIIYGQDNISPITKSTSHVLYVAYGPAGIAAELVEEHLQKIESNIRLFSTNAVVEQLHLLRAN
jgi:DNA/RNA-binding domain of Phe-tRNA-synthetase-like protein